jgi:DNA polymerase (family 10)
MSQDIITKKDVMRILEEIATLLEIKGENPFKSRAYYAAARSIETMDIDLALLVEEGRLSSMKGIGKALEQKITELVTTGKLEYYEKLKASVPPGLIEMLRIQHLGPKKINALYEKLGITTIGELEYACL